MMCSVEPDTEQRDGRFLTGGGVARANLAVT
jgi:hypothetical protein